MSGSGGVVGVDMDGVAQRHANLAPAGVANILQPATCGEIEQRTLLNFAMVLNIQMLAKV